MKQSRQQRIFLRAAASDVIYTRPGVQVRPQNGACDAARVLDLENALRRDPGPVRNGWLRNSNPAREFGDATDGANSLLESPVSHGSFLLIQAHAAERREQNAEF